MKNNPELSIRENLKNFSNENADLPYSQQVELQELAVTNIFIERKLEPYVLKREG